METKLFREERLHLIMEKIGHEKKIVVKQLAQQFDRSLPSIRLDLAELEARGLITRTHGGAILEDAVSNNYVNGKGFLDQREATKKAEKERMAKATVALIRDGDSVMIDGGSSTYYVAKRLGEKRGLTIITTSYHMMTPLLEIPDAKIYLTGGLIHRDFEDLIGDITVDALHRFKPDFCIMGMDGVSLKHGFTTTEPSMANIKKQMFAVADKSIVVCDSSKFEKICLMQVADLEEVSVIVTDSEAPQEYVERLQNSSTQLIKA